MTTQDELMERITDVHNRFFACFEGFDETVLETQPVCGVWSARDLAGHLTDWHNDILDAAENVVNESHAKGRPVADIDAYNADRAALRGIDSWTDTEADLRDAWQRADRMVNSLSEDDLSRIGTLPWGQVERLENFFKELSDHVLEHLGEAEQWRWRMLGVPERHENR